MALAQDIEFLRANSIASLDAAHDYYIHTKKLWRLLQVAVEREGRKFTLKNPQTSHAVNQDDMLKLAQPYVTQYLANDTFQQFVSRFEDFLFDFLRHWILQKQPFQRFNRKQIPVSEILKAPDLDALKNLVVDRELNEVKYGSVNDWFVFLNGTVELGCPSSAEIKQLAEIKNSRDILVHNKGVVNDTYVRKAGALARFNPGQMLDISEPYHRESWLLIKKIINDVADAALQRI